MIFEPWLRFVCWVHQTVFFLPGLYARPKRSRTTFRYGLRHITLLLSLWSFSKGPFAAYFGGSALKHTRCVVIYRTRLLKSTDQDKLIKHVQSLPLPRSLMNTILTRPSVLCPTATKLNRREQQTRVHDTKRPNSPDITRALSAGSGAQVGPMGLLANGFNMTYGALLVLQGEALMTALFVPQEPWFVVCVCCCLYCHRSASKAHPADGELRSGLSL